MGLKFNPFTGKLDLTGAGGGSPTGPAGGDLAGTYPNPTVDGLQGRPVSNATPYNGQVLQYDGTNWVPGSIPSGGSGGGGVVYYLNFNTAADAPVTNIPQTPNATKELGIVADTVATSYLSPILSTASYDFLASFVTDLNVPSATAIPAGIWDFNTFVESTTTNSANQVYFKIEILKYDGVNAPTLLATSNDTYIYDPTEITQYVTSVVMPQTTILSTDRIVVYLYGRAHQNNNRLTFHFGGQYPSHTHSTMPSVTGTGVVKVVNGVFQSPATTIVNTDVSASAAIDVSKLAMSTNRILGRTTAGTGAVEEISVGTGLSLTGGTLSNTVTAGVTSVTATAPITSSGGATPDISTSMATNRLIGRTTAGTGVMEEISTAGTLMLTGGTLTGTGVGGSVGAVDNAVLRADVGTGVVQNSSIIIDDETTATQNNVAIRNNDSQTNSALVLSPKGTGALIAQKPNGAASGGNARGANAVDLQMVRSAATQVASGARSFIGGGSNNTASGADGVVCGGVTNTANGQQAFVGGGSENVAGTNCGVVAGYQNNASSANNRNFIGAGDGNETSGFYCSILGGANALADRRGMQAHASGQFSIKGDAQRARFVLRCKTTTNTGVEMALDGGTTYLTIPAGKVMFMNIKVTGSKSDGSAVATYERQYAVKHISATATSSEIYAPITIGTDFAAGTSLEVAVVDAGDYVRIRPTGIAAETWRWVASVDAVEVAYGT